MIDNCSTCDRTLSDEGQVFSRIVSKCQGPLWVTLELTRRCNLSCPHCYQSGPGVDDELGYESVVSVLNQLADAGTMFLTVTGGEVGTYPRRMDVLRAAAERRFAVKLKTNGTLWTPSDLEEMTQLGIFEVHVSLYHLTPEKHDGFVGLAGAFKRAMGVMRHFHDNGVRVRVMVVLMNWNLDAALPLAQMCAQKGYPVTFDFRIENTEDGSPQPAQFQADAAALAEIIPKIEFFSSQLPIRDGAPNGAEPICALGQSSLLITAAGNVYPCGVADGLWLGNVHHETVLDIWNGSRRRQLNPPVWGDSVECMRCEKSAYCHRCPVSAAASHGDYMRHSVLDCRMAGVRQLAVKKMALPRKM